MAMIDRIKKIFKLGRLRELYIKYERYLIPGALLLGFITDVVTFRFINFDLAILALCGHLIFAGLSISIINLYEDGVIRGKFFSYARVFAPLVLQYTFGALFSAFVIFYFSSGSIFASWPFIAVLVFLMIANEIFRKYNVRPDIQISVYFFAIFSFANLAVPYLIRNIGLEVFIGSGIISLALASLFLWGLYSFSPRVQRVKKVVIGGIVGVFITMNIFYFTNLIPPIPLSIRDIGVYYSVERTPAGDYIALSHQREGFDVFLPYRRYFVTSNFDSAYVFSSVFAPERLNVEVVHEWQFLDTEERRWVTLSTVPFSIVGGRDDGYRGYSRKTNMIPGRWRVNVKTFTGQTIGRVQFRVIAVDQIPDLETEIK